MATKLAKLQLEVLEAKEGPLHKLADSHSPKLSVAIRYAFASARAAMRPALQSREDIKKATALGIVTLRQELKAILPKALRKIYVAGGELAVTRLSKDLRGLEEFRAAKQELKPKIEFKFDVTNESAVSWADRHSAELIDGISETSREAINNAVAEFLETGDFKELREEILAAVGDVARADRIARNEPMVAVHEGQRAAWDQAVEEGLLPENAVREWIVVGDDKVCPICEGLEGKTAALGEEYEEGIEGPPAHVMCRCSEGLSSFKSLGGQGSGNFGHAGRPGEVGGSSSEGGSSSKKEESRSKLHAGNVTNKKTITGSINGVHKITLRDAEGDEVEAIFKPSSGEAWTSEEVSRNQVEAYKEDNDLNTEEANEQLGSEFGFGDDEPVRETITNRDFSYADREAAAYELDEALGLNVVPPTIVREIDGERGMVQQFVETGGLGLHDAGIDQDSVYGLAILDIATGNTDRHAGNVLIDTDRRVVAIDQGLSFPDDSDYHDNYQFRPDATMNLLAENQGAMSENMSSRIAKSLVDTDWDKLTDKWSMSEGEKDSFFARLGRLKTVFQAPDAMSRSYGVRTLISNMAKESNISASHSSRDVKHINTDAVKTGISQ
jgi:hypothetical protein